MYLKNEETLDRRSVMLMLASVILFAANTLLIRAVAAHYPGADGWMATLFRGVVGMAIVFALFGWGRGFAPGRMFASRLITIRGVVGAASIVIFYVTIVKLGAARAVILNLTYPMFATAIAAVWLREKISRGGMLWMAVGFGGLVVFLSGGSWTGVSGYDLLGLIGAVGAGWVVVIIRHLRNEEHPATIYAAQTFYSMLAALPVAAKVPQLPAPAWVGLAIAAVVVAGAQLIMTWAYQRISVSRGSALQMLLPLATAAGSFLCFGEVFPPVEIAGALLTLFATWRVVVAR